MADGADADGDGIMSSADSNDNSFGGSGLAPEDLDRDGTPNYLDLDSDGDGINDLTEATGTYDSDGLANGTDSDGDGMRGNYTSSSTVADNYDGFGGKGISLKDSDGDGYPDAYDIDSDNDGITDNVEGQSTCSYKLPVGTDADGDGMDDAYEVSTNSCSKAAGGITPYDKDADGIPDYLDSDSDNDGVPDTNEGAGITGSYVTSTTDADKDGLYDQWDSYNIKTSNSNFTYNVLHSNMGSNGNFDGPATPGSSSKLVQSQTGDCPTVDRDWRNTTILPVTLVSFKGNLNNGLVRLDWVSVNELNLNNYIIERSTNGTTFTPITTVAAKGNIQNTVYTTSDDVSTLAGVVYYRLRMTDKNGTYRNSTVISFKLNTKPVAVTVHPNPAASYYNIRINTQKDATATIRVTDMIGKVISVSTVKLVTGSNTIAYSNLSSYATGTYNVQVLMDGELYNEKLIIVR